MKSIISLLIISIFSLSPVFAWTITGGGDHGGVDWQPNCNSEISGNHTNVGVFFIPAGCTVYIKVGIPLEITAGFIHIRGTLDANGRGYPKESGPGAGGNGNSGGGGGHGGTGGSAGGSGGVVYGSASSFEALMGSGGGTGSRYCTMYSTSPSVGLGGAGGGAIVLNSTLVKISGKVYANGADGGYSNCLNVGGGGGSGGTILIDGYRVELLTGSLLNANGGAGRMGGGGGGGGRIKIFYEELVNNSAISVSGSGNGATGTVYFSTDSKYTQSEFGFLGEATDKNNSVIVAGVWETVRDGLTRYDTKIFVTSAVEATIPVDFAIYNSERELIWEASTVEYFPTNTTITLNLGSQYEINNLDSADGGYILVLKIGNLQFNASVRWTSSGLEVISPLKFEKVWEKIEVPPANASITSLLIFDTSQERWRENGDVFVLPTEEIEVLIEIKNTGSVTQNEWYVGLDFFRYSSNNRSKKLDLQVYYDGKSKTGNNLQGFENASCSLVEDPNGNGVFEVGETIKVACKAPASIWVLVDISKGEYLVLRAHERDLTVDAGRNGNAGNDWWTDALARVSSDLIEQEVVFFEKFEAGLPQDWGTDGYNAWISSSETYFGGRKYCRGDPTQWGSGSGFSGQGFTGSASGYGNCMDLAYVSLYTPTYYIRRPGIVDFYWHTVTSGCSSGGMTFNIINESGVVYSLPATATPWSHAEVEIKNRGNYGFSWKAQITGQAWCDTTQTGYLDEFTIRLKPPYAYDNYNIRIYTYTKKRDWCQYRYYLKWKNPSQIFERVEEFGNPTHLVGVECDTNNFFKLDEFTLLDYEFGTWYFSWTQEWWYGPAGYRAVGKDGAEAVDQCTNSIYNARCYAENDDACLAYLNQQPQGEQCIAEDWDTDPFDISCSLYSSYPEGYSITKKFCPKGTIGAADGGCYPLDYVRPSINIISPLDGETVNTNTIMVRGTAYDERGLSNVEVRVNDGPFELVSGNISWEKQVTLIPGQNLVVARATNNLGFTATSAITINYEAADMISPNVSILHPGANQKFETNTIIVSGSASDNVALRDVKVKLNYGDWDLADGTSSWSKLLTLRWGANTITVRAVDTSGGVAESSVLVYYFKPITVKPSLPQRKYEEPEITLTLPTAEVGSVTGVTTGLFNFSTSYEELVEAVEYQRRILDGTYDVAGRNVTYSEGVDGSVEAVSPSPNETIVTANSTTLVWRFPELGNGEVLSSSYVASFELLPMEKKNLSRASVNYTDGVTGERVYREFPILVVEALSIVNLSVNTSKASYLPNDEFVFNVLLVNNGGVELQGLRHGGVIVTPTGEFVQTPDENIILLPPLGSLVFSRVLGKQRLLTPGNYTVRYSVADSRGIVLANSSASFEVLRVVGAELEVGTDKPAYGLGETLGLFVGVNNTSPNTPLEDALVSIVVSKNGSTFMEAIRNVSTLARGSQETYYTYLALNETGVYVVNATLWIRNGNLTPLDTANTSFVIKAVPELVISEVLSRSEARALKTENATVKVLNVGGGVAKNVSLMALLPFGFTSLAHKGSYVNESNAIEWILGAINGFDNTTRGYAFVTPFIYSYTPVEYTLRAKAFYVDEVGKLYSASTSEKLVVKPIPVVEAAIGAEKNVIYIGNEVGIHVNLSNVGYDDAVNISAVVLLPHEMEVVGYDNASFDNSSNSLNWSIAGIPANNSITLNLTAKALPITSVRNLTFQLNVTYHDEDSYVYYNYSSTEIKVIPILVLAWGGDESDGWFADNATGGIAYVKKVNTTSALMNELRNNYYNVLWLMNMGHCEYNCSEEGGLNSTEIDEIKTWLNENTSLTRELLFSDFTLKANPKLGEAAGFKYVGSLPMGEPYQPRNLTITETHYLTDGYVGANLSVVGWLDKIQPEYTYNVLAYADDLLPTKEVESYPAMTLSYYNNSRVVFLAADIGLSSYEGLNSSVWLDIARRALLWSTLPAENVTSLNVFKTVKPEDARGKAKSAKEHITLDLFSSGNLPAGSVSVAEFFPTDFTVDSTDGNTTNASVTWSLGDLAPWTSNSLQCVLLAPEVNQTTSYTLLTVVNYTAPSGNLSIVIPSNVTVEPKGGGKP